MIALILYGPRLLRSLRGWRGLWGVAIAWVSVALSQARLIGAEATGAMSGSLGSGDWLQIAFLGLGSLMTLALLLRAPSPPSGSKLPVLALGVYAFLGMATAFMGAKPLLSLFKASQLLVFAALAWASIGYVGRGSRPRFLLEVVYVLLTAILVSTALGGIFAVEGAYRTLYVGGGGLFGVTLYSVFPHLHPNGLGLLAAIMILVGIRRAMEPARFRQRFFYFALATLAFSVMFAAQSRTALIALVLGLMLLAVTVRRFRAMFWAIVAGAVIVGLYSVLSGGGAGIEDDVVAYLKRGQEEKQITSMSGRTRLWEIGERMFMDRPLLGHGFQTGARFAGTPYGLAVGSNMHNAHLQVLVDSGLAGYAVWLLFSAGIAWRCFKTLRRARPGSSEEARFAAELGAIGLMLFLRTGVGHVLVSLDFNTIIYVALFIGICVERSLRRAVAGVALNKKPRGD